MHDEESAVDAERLVYLMILGFVMEEMQAMFPRMRLDPGTKSRQLAERITARLVLEADMLPIVPP